MKRLMILMAAACLLLAGCGSNAALEMDDVKAAELSLSAEETALEPASAGADPETIYVYICGAVHDPGVYPLPAGSRVYELVEAAGGMTKKAVAGSVNLAEGLTDGEMVTIPTEEDLSDGIRALPDPGSGDEGRINLNTASREDLMTLSGIGQAKADSIVAWREANGGFSKPEDILLVDGIGNGIYARIKDDITV